MMNKTRIRCLGASWAIALAMLPCGLAAQDNSGHAHAQAEAAKQEGDQLIKEHNDAAAIDQYSRAIQLDPKFIAA